MALKIERGIIPVLMKDLKKAATTGGVISQVEIKRTVDKGIKLIKDDFAGATSEKGLANARNALARTVRAADRNWDLTPAAGRMAKELLGSKLDGKGGKLHEVETKIRSDIRSPSFGGYGGGSGRGGGSGIYGGTRGGRGGGSGIYGGTRGGRG